MNIMQKIKVFAFAKFQAFLMSLIGLVAGVLYSFGGLFIDFFTIGLNFGTALAFLSLIGMPLVFGIFGFVLGLVEAILFNLTPNWFKEIRPEFEK